MKGWQYGQTLIVVSIFRPVRIDIASSVKSCSAGVIYDLTYTLENQATLLPDTLPSWQFVIFIHSRFPENQSQWYFFIFLVKLFFFVIFAN